MTNDKIQITIQAQITNNPPARFAARRAGEASKSTNQIQKSNVK